MYGFTGTELCIHPSSMVTRCKVKYTDFWLENSNIISGILYNQFSIDRDSCGDIVGYFNVAPRQIYEYKNWQGKPAQLLIYSLG